MSAADISAHGPLEGNTTLWDGMERVQGSLRPQDGKMVSRGGQTSHVSLFRPSSPSVLPTSHVFMSLHVCVSAGE